jgi:DNA (cytosine-5)-methyltransferase 1
MQKANGKLTGPPSSLPAHEKALTFTGLFAGVGGFASGLVRAGHELVMLCEIDSGARRVLDAHFPSIPLKEDIRALKCVPEVDLIAAGFPCQDLSQAGQMAGIRGSKSSLVNEIFRLLATSKKHPTWVLLENVPFMLRLERGRAIRLITRTLASLGFTWAYRTVDTRSFGLPHRRHRVILLASRTEDPRDALLSDDAPHSFAPNGHTPSACGFYWTEGNNGLGWAEEAIPPLKGGSGCGIPSPPAIWVPLEQAILTPDIRDAERLQGFPADWTAPSVGDGIRAGRRWQLVGNAVSVPLAKWIGSRLRCPGTYLPDSGAAVSRNDPWPQAAWGSNDKVFRANVSTCPLKTKHRALLSFLKYPLQPLSLRATAGFFSRAMRSSLRFADGFLDDVAEHLRRLESSQHGKEGLKR